jgi:hypothetical protein
MTTKYMTYAETKYADRKRAGINVKVYRPSIDPLPVCVAIVAMIILSGLVLVLAGIL